MISGPVFEGAAVKDSMQKAMEVRLADMETRLTSKILLELDGIKSALNIGSDGSDEDDGIPMQ